MWGLRGPQEQSTWGSGGVLELSTHTLEQGESSNMSPLSGSFSRARDPQGLTSKADLQECCRSSLQTAGVWRLSLLTLRSFHLCLVHDLLLSLINLINNVALIYSYAPRETFILSESQSALYLAQQSNAQNYCQHSISSAACTPSPPIVYQAAMVFTSTCPLLDAFQVFYFVLSTSAACMCRRGDGLEPLACSLSPESFRVLCKPLRLFYLAELSQTSVSVRDWS